ncbi:MAG TPA: fatty-acid oxidation protein subunit alpha, partial [Pasteurellaceae bacterium]|nr:fatty-acid oxidation protein subunit alpha [Pasteurellaceae bacterium]
PRVIGLKDAAPLLFTGDKINAKKALELGLVDQLTEKTGLISTACCYILQQKRINDVSSKTALLWKKAKNFLGMTQFTRNQALERIESRISQRVFDNYCAGETLMNALKQAEFKDGLVAERAGLCNLFYSEQSRVLRHLECTAREMKW